MAAAGHRRGDRRAVRAALVTVSDTRDESDDRSGDVLAGFLEGAGHRVASRRILPDDPRAVASAVRELVEAGDCDAVLLTGGTGLSPRDTTYEAVAGLLTKTLDGFGELFRALSFEEIGPAAMLSRAVAGASGTCFIAVMPGSPAAVRLAMERLILPELGHVVGLLRPGPLDSAPGTP